MTVVMFVMVKGAIDRPIRQRVLCANKQHPSASRMSLLCRNWPSSIRLSMRSAENYVIFSAVKAGAYPNVLLAPSKYPNKYELFIDDHVI